MKEEKISYEVIAKFENDKLEWEFDNLEEAKRQYESAKNYKCVKEVECNKVVTVIEKTSIF